MLKKRLIASVCVKNNIAVQSISYSKYLPLGLPEIIVENLARWQADEILINFIDRSLKKLGPDFKNLALTKEESIDLCKLTNTDSNKLAKCLDEIKVQD